jgi:hypothetical protein
VRVSPSRWVPRLAAVVTSWSVSPARLASSTPLRLDHGGWVGLGFGGVGGQRLYHQPGPPAAQPGAHRVAAVGRQPVPQQRRLLPAERPAQLAERADQGVGVVGVDLMEEGELGAAAAGAVAQPGRQEARFRLNR